MSEATAVEREQQLVKLRKQMGRVLRRGDTAEFDRLSAEYGRLKGEHAQLIHEEYVAERRAVRAAVRAQEARERPKPWRLPPGFGRSPLAQQRDRGGWRPREEPQGPAGGLRPWRRGSPASEVIWRP